jgi:hypothetical protein
VPACEQKLTGLLVGGLYTASHRLASLLAQLEPDRIPGFLLTHSGAINGKSMRRHVLDLEADDITASEFTVDGEIEHGEIAFSTLDL